MFGGQITPHQLHWRASGNIVSVANALR